MGRTLDDILATPTPSTGITTTILVDGDIVAYRPAAVVDGRMYQVTNQPGCWKYKKDVDKFCKENGLSLGDIFSIYEPEPVEHALAAVKMQMRSIEMSLMTHCDRYVIETWLSDPATNFRHSLNPDYKANRKGVRKPYHLSSCKEYLVKHWNAQWAVNLEADDMLTIRATELEKQGKKFIIASQDKDLKQKSGWHYNWVTEKYWHVSEAEAREILWTQVVVGDTTDNILTPLGVGPAKAKKLFKGIDWINVTDEELFAMVTGLYSEYQGKNGKVRKDSGIPPNHDFTDMLCWVKQTYDQVFLLRSRPQ